MDSRAKKLAIQAANQAELDTDTARVEAAQDRQLREQVQFYQGHESGEHRVQTLDGGSRPAVKVTSGGVSGRVDTVMAGGRAVIDHKPRPQRPTEVEQERQTPISGYAAVLTQKDVQVGTVMGEPTIIPAVPARTFYAIVYSGDPDFVASTPWQSGIDGRYMVADRNISGYRCFIDRGIWSAGHHDRDAVRDGRQGQEYFLRFPYPEGDGTSYGELFAGTGWGFVGGTMVVFGYIPDGEPFVYPTTGVLTTGCTVDHVGDDTGFWQILETQPFEAEPEREVPGEEAPVYRHELWLGGAFQRPIKLLDADNEASITATVAAYDADTIYVDALIISSEGNTEKSFKVSRSRQTAQSIAPSDSLNWRRTGTGYCTGQYSSSTVNFYQDFSRVALVAGDINQAQPSPVQILVNEVQETGSACTFAGEARRANVTVLPMAQGAGRLIGLAAFAR